MADTNPAPVSGPGRLSQRTDGGPSQKLMAPTGMEYGGQKTLLDQERTAPMAQADSQPTAAVPAAAAGGGGGAPYSGPGMGDPSTRPDEPVTAGVNIGAGGGPEAMAFDTGTQRPDGYVTSLIQAAAGRDTTGTLADLYLMAQQRGV